MAPLYILPGPEATRVLLALPTRVVMARQATTTLVVSTSASASDSISGNLSDGAIAGTVLGSITGFVLLLWILRSCSNLGRSSEWGSTFGSNDALLSYRAGGGGGTSSTVYKVEQRPHRHHHHHHYRHGRSRRSRSPRGVEVIRSVSTTRPVYVDGGAWDLREPRPVYYSRDVRRDIRSRRDYY